MHNCSPESDPISAVLLACENTSSSIICCRRITVRRRPKPPPSPVGTSLSHLALLSVLARRTRNRQRRSDAERQMWHAGRSLCLYSRHVTTARVEGSLPSFFSFLFFHISFFPSADLDPFRRPLSFMKREPAPPLPHPLLPLRLRLSFSFLAQLYCRDANADISNMHSTLPSIVSISPLAGVSMFFSPAKSTQYSVSGGRNGMLV